MSTPPRWDMSNVYPSLASKEFKAAVADYKQQVASLEKFFDRKVAVLGPKTPASELAPLVGDAINRINRIQALSGTIVPFIYSYVTTDFRDQAAMRALSEFEQASLPMSKLFTRFNSWLGRIAPKLEKVSGRNKIAAAHAFMLNEAAEQSRFQMATTRKPSPPSSPSAAATPSANCRAPSPPSFPSTSSWMARCRNCPCRRSSTCARIPMRTPVTAPTMPRTSPGSWSRKHWQPA